MSARGFLVPWLGRARFVSTRHPVASVIPLRSQHRDRRVAEVQRRGHGDADSAAVGGYGQMCTAAGGCWRFRPSVVNQPSGLEAMAIYSDSSGGQEVHRKVSGLAPQKGFRRAPCLASP